MHWQDWQDLDQVLELARQQTVRCRQVFWVIQLLAVLLYWHADDMLEDASEPAVVKKILLMSPSGCASAGI